MDEILKTKLSKKLKELFKDTKDPKRTETIIKRLDEYVTMDISSFRNDLNDLMADIIDD